MLDVIMMDKHVRQMHGPSSWDISVERVLAETWTTVKRMTFLNQQTSEFEEESTVLISLRPPLGESVSEDT